MPPDILSDKLLNFLNKISLDTPNAVDESYLDKLLTSISKEISSNSVEEIIKWFQCNIEKWSEISKNVIIACFLIKLGGIIARDESRFISLQQARVFDKIMEISDTVKKNSAVRCSYLVAFSNVIQHKAGQIYLKEAEVWKNVTALALTDPSIYVRRQAREYLQLVLKFEKKNIDFSKEILEEILKPVNQYLKADLTNIQESEVEKVVVPSLKLLNGVLDDCVTIENANALPHLLVTQVQFDLLLKEWAEVSTRESFLDAIVTSYGTLVLTSMSNSDTRGVLNVLDLYRVLLKSKRTCAILTLSRVCHMIWVRMSGRRECADLQTEMHFFIMQLMPLLVSLRRRETSSLLDQYVNKLLDKASEETIRMAYMLRDVIRQETPELLVQKATRTVHSLMDYHHLMNRENVVLTFQTLTWVLKNFVPASCDGDTEPELNEIQDSRDLCESAAPLLSAVLQALCTLLPAYRITWNEAIEGLCHLKLCHCLLSSSLSTKMLVLTLRMTKLTIAQFMPPSLVLLVDRIEGTSLEAVAPLLVRKLHDPQWEVRDSTLEVVAVIADLALVKYPAFQELLLSLKFPSLAVSMLEGDAESYVRASAVHAIAAMVPLDKVWDEALASLQVGRIVQSVILADSEAIVRREVALLLASLLRHCRVPRDYYGELLQTMMAVTINDLHWEVRVNALSFWSEVIDLEFQEQGMVDGIFPPVTFSRTSKKIVQLTEKEVQRRLRIALEQLSRVGCLNALLSALEDDCDQEVVDKATELISKLLQLLRCYRLIPAEANDMTKKRKCSPDRKPCRVFSIGSTSSEGQMIDPIVSDDVIESIVNTSDLKLLVGVVVGDSDNVQASGKQAVQMVPVDVFLTHIQDLDVSVYSECNSVADLAQLLDNVLSLNQSSDTQNVPDCY